MKKAIFRLIALCAFMLLFVWNIVLTFYCDALHRAVFELALLMDETIILAEKDARNLTNITLLLEGMQELNPAYVDKAMRD